MARASDDYRSCIPAMQRWIRFFTDPHLMVWQAAPPSTSRPLSSEAAPITNAAPDPDRPTLRFTEETTAVVRLPALDPEYKAVLDSLVSGNRTRLLTISTLAVDLRGNGGGCTCTYDAIVPFIYAGPFREPGQDLWTSPANVAFVRGWLADPAMPETFKAEVRGALRRLEAAPNTFVPFPADTVVRLDTVLPLPRAVAVVVDEKCASSCEDFVLMARQSAKVTIVGTGPTAGVHDYGNVRSVWLPGWRRLRLPTSRSRRLPAEPIDNVGLTPAVRIPAGTRDTIAFAIRVASARASR